MTFYLKNSNSHMIDNKSIKDTIQNLMEKSTQPLRE